MFTHEAVHRPHRFLSRSLLTIGTAGAVVATLAGPATADTPDAWETAPDVSPLAFLLVLLIIPLGIALVLALLTILPSLARDRGYEPGQSWRSDAEWFGGPTKGVQAASEVTPEQIESRSKDTGGTSAGW